MLVLTGSPYKETTKARYIYCLISLFESSIISFITPFINDAVSDLKFDNIFLSIILGLLPLFTFIFILFFSFFASKHKNIVTLMKIILLINFILCFSFGFFILYFNTSTEINKRIFFIIIALFSSIIIAMHSSLTTLQSNSIAFINQKEKTPYGYVCLYGSMLTVIMSPIAGIIADCIYTDYHGYSFLFLFFSPLILLTFIVISFLKPCVNVLDDVKNSEFKVRDLLQNKTYLNYFLIVIILMPFNSLTNSLSSTMWTMRKTNYTGELFSSRTWGIILACQAFVETLIIYINVKVGLSKKVENNFKIATVALSTSLVFLSIAASIILKDYSITFFIMVLLSMSIRGINTGIYLTSNFGNLNKMMNYRYRTKAVFLQNGTYQIINCIFSFIYPLLIVDRDPIDDVLILLLFALFAVSISINYTLQKDKYQKISF